jgi:hypothetical protein
MTDTRSREPEIIGSFAIRQSGNIGQEILDADGRIKCWTTDPWLAQVICKLLTENEGLLGAASQMSDLRIANNEMKGK